MDSLHTAWQCNGIVYNPRSAHCQRYKVSHLHREGPPQPLQTKPVTSDFRQLGPGLGLSTGSCLLGIITVITRCWLLFTSSLNKKIF